MKKFAHFDDSFDISHTNNYEITIQFGRNGYSYSVNSLLNNRCVTLGLHEFGGSLHTNDLAQRLTSFLDSQEFLTKNFSKVNFIFTSAKSTLVPEEYFKKERLKELYSFNYPLTTDENLEYMELKSIKAYQIFAFPASLATVMVNRYKDVNFSHQSSAMIEVFTKKATLKEAHSAVLLHFTDDLVDIVVSKQQKLLLHNTFEAASDTDRLYYAAFVINQLKLNLKSTPIYLVGNIDEDGSLYKLLSTYFGNLKLFSELNKTYNLPAPKHQLANLINF